MEPELLPDAGKQVRERLQAGPVRTARKCESVRPREGFEEEGVLSDEVGEALSRQRAVCETTDERVPHRGLRYIGIVAPQRL